MTRNARLVFDSRETGALVGTRAGAGDDRTLLFASESHSIDMMIFASEEGLHVVHGQVVDAVACLPIEGAWVRLGEMGEPVETDDYGQFAVSTMADVDGSTLRVDTGTEDIDCLLPHAPQANGASQ